MKKTAIIVMMLILCAVVSYAGVGYESMVKFNDRILELKLELQKQLLMKKYDSQVIGGFEVQGDTVLLRAYSIPLEGEKSFSISEVRNIETFEIAKSSSVLPEMAKGTVTAGNSAAKGNSGWSVVAKGVILGGLILLAALTGMIIRNRKRMKQKRAIRRKEKVEEKERLAA